MSPQEFGTIAAAIKAAWPSANIMPDKQSKDVWYTMLADLEYQVCLAALKEHMCSCKFPPSISELRGRCAGLVSRDIPDWSDAWGSVMDAIRFYGMYRENEALESLDVITRKCVKRLGFKNICTSENIVAERANFRMIYEQEAKDMREYRQLPAKLRDQKDRIRMLSLETSKKLPGGSG